MNIIFNLLPATKNMNDFVKEFTCIVCPKGCHLKVDDKLNVLSSVVTSQIDVHSRFGGVIPEVASRMHVEQISTIVDSAIKEAKIFEAKDKDNVVKYVNSPLL